jgi:hypothetical protein
MVDLGFLNPKTDEGKALVEDAKGLDPHRVSEGLSKFDGQVF